ncbi:MAG: Hsp20/alpha crystallin family protein [Syntrophales bacterium]
MAEKELTTKARSGRSLPVRREPERFPFFSLAREMNRLFEDFFGREIARPFEAEEWYETFPRIDVRESDKKITVTAELPGMEEKDIDLLLTADSLTIKGEKKEEIEEKEENYLRMERRYGAFHRVIPLPEEIDAEKAEANFKNGILRVDLPKSEKAGARKKRVPIKSEMH